LFPAGSETMGSGLLDLARKAQVGLCGFDDEAVANGVIADCDGDPRAAVRALVTVNRYLVRENRRLTESVSPGYMRGSGGHRR
jgi:hypothetical protein